MKFLPMKKSIFILSSLAAITLSCTNLKVLKLMKQGEVEQKNFKVEVPFEIKLGLIIIPAKVNGKEYDFILDTGAPNVITTEAAQELKLVQTSRSKATDSQGKKEEIGFLTLESVEIGGINFKNTGTAVADFSASPTLSCFQSSGLIGSNLMRNAIWQFDFESNTIIIASSRDSLNIPPNATKISFETAVSGTPKLDLLIGKLKDENVLLDLGSNGGYTTTDEMYTKLQHDKDLISAVKANGSASAGLFGSGSGHEYLIQVSSFSLDTLTFENQQITCKSADKKLLGTEFFQNFNLTIDWFTNEIFLVQNAESVNLAYNGFGFATIFRENKLMIDYLLDHESAKNAGLKLGDQLIKFDDFDVENISIDSYCELLPTIKSKNKNESVSIEVRKASGEKTSMVLKKIVL